MIFIPNILDFLSGETFIALQNKFMDYDERCPGINEYNLMNNKPLLITKVVLKDFKIIYKDIDQGDKEDYKDIFFYKDFLNTVIPKLSINEMSKIKRELDSTFKYKISERKLYLEEQLLKLKELDKVTYMSFFLNDNFKIEILNQIRIILEFIHKDVVWKSPKDDANKIKLKLSRAEIICLFYLLKQKGLTESKYDNELGRLIDDTFMYFKEAEKSYKAITTSNKTLSGYKNGDKPINTVLSNLKKLLSNDDFYEIKS